MPYELFDHLAGEVELHFDLFATGGHLGDLGLEPDFFEGLLGVGEDRTHEVRIGTVEEGFQQLDNDDLVYVGSGAPGNGPGVGKLEVQALEV